LKALGCCELIEEYQVMEYVWEIVDSEIFL
jgi:hypothetical protein